MEQEHPIPQQISAYQFRLVGDMTLKQFFQVAGGALLSLLIYSSNFAPYVKWPLILLSFLAGIAFAFFPLEDRPLSKWLFLFIKAIYSPTLYSWRKIEKRPQYFQSEPTLQTAQTVSPAVSVPAAVPAIAVQAASTPKEITKFEQGEKEFMSKVTAHFKTSAPITMPVQTPYAAKKIPVPQTVKPHVDVSKKEIPVVESKPTLTSSNVGAQISPFAGQKAKDTHAVEFSQQASPPIPPSKPNVIVGQVVDVGGKIVENAILEIRDEEGRPVRALKSNKLGHFMIVTPLANGGYEITTEKEGFQFQPLSFQAQGEIIPPVIVRANKNTNPNEGIVQMGNLSSTLKP